MTQKSPTNQNLVSIVLIVFVRFWLFVKLKKCFWLFFIQISIYRNVDSFDYSGNNSIQLNFKLLRYFKNEKINNKIPFWLLRLEISCDNSCHGCEVVVKLDLLPHHLKECEHNPKRPVTCTQGCGQTVAKDEMKVKKDLGGIKLIRDTFIWILISLMWIRMEVSFNA